MCTNTIDVACRPYETLRYRYLMKKNNNSNRRTFASLVTSRSSAFQRGRYTHLKLMEGSTDGEDSRKATYARLVHGNFLPTIDFSATYKTLRTAPKLLLVCDFGLKFNQDMAAQQSAPKTGILHWKLGDLQMHQQSHQDKDGP